MSVAFCIQAGAVTRAWYDRNSGLLCAEINGMVEGIAISQFPDHYFQSGSPIVKISAGTNGAEIVCRHKDGAETRFPSAIWLRGGFNPSLDKPT